MTRTPPVRADLAEMAFLANQALTESLVAAQVDASDLDPENPNLLSIFNDHGFAVFIQPLSPRQLVTLRHVGGAEIDGPVAGRYQHVILRHLGGAEIDAVGPDVDQLLWGFLGVETIFGNAADQPCDFEAP